MAVARIATPSKGRLSSAAVALLRKIGLNVSLENDRRLLADIGKGKFQVLFANARDIPEYVEAGAADVGITGLDLVREQAKDVEVLRDLGFGHCRLTLAAPEPSGIAAVSDIPDGARVATTFPRLTAAHFERLGKRVEILPISGAAEVTPHIGVSDLICDLVETGSTLRMNRLVPVDVVLESTAVLLANRRSLREKETELNELVWAMESVIAAERKRYVMANLPKEKVGELGTFLPGVSGPTVMNILGREDLVAIHAVVGAEEVNAVLSLLKMIGATGILVVPIERMIA